jgi:hypothetical protein
VDEELYYWNLANFLNIKLTLFFFERSWKLEAANVVNTVVARQLSVAISLKSSGHWIMAGWVK